MVGETPEASQVRSLPIVEANSQDTHSDKPYTTTVALNHGLSECDTTRRVALKLSRKADADLPRQQRAADPFIPDPREITSRY